VLFDSGTALFEVLSDLFLLGSQLALRMENLLHLDKELVVPVSHLPPRRRVDPHCFVVTAKFSDLEVVVLIDFWPLMGNHCPDRQEQLKHLSGKISTLMMWLVESKLLYDSWIDRGISSSLFLVIQGCLRASLTLYRSSYYFFEIF
jgi:hypothetical protein